MKTLRDICEGLLKGQDATLVDGNKQLPPDAMLNKKCKDFKELIEMFALYFGVKVPRIVKKSHLQWELNYTQTYCYSDVDYVKFMLNDPNTGRHTVEIINAGIKRKYPVFRIQSKYYDGVLRNSAITTVYGETTYGEKSYEYGKDYFYDWIINNNDQMFKKWLEFNQNPG